MNTLAKRIIAGVAVAVVVGGGVAYAAYPSGVDVSEVKRLDINASINTVGTVEADEVLTVYAPLSGKISKIDCKVNDTVKAEDILAEYDSALFDEEFKRATLNSEYYSDGYNAAISENNINKSKKAAASASADALQGQYIAVEENRDDISIAQNSKSIYIQSTMQGIQGVLDNMNTDLELRSAKLEEASGAYNELYVQSAGIEADIAGKNSQIADLNKRIKANADEYNRIKDDTDKAEEAKALLELNQKLSESLVELQNGLAGEKTQYNTVKDALNGASSAKDAAEKNVNTTRNDIMASRDALASLPVDAMSTEQYALYLELTRQLDVIEREWNRKVEEKAAADEKIISDYQISQYEDSVELAQIDLDKAQDRLDKSKEGVKATASGTILSKAVNEGAYIEEGDELFRIQPDSGYKVAVKVSKYDIGSVEIGQRAEVTLSTQKYAAKVSAISPIATNDSAGKPMVKVELSFDDGEVKPTIGLEVDVKISTGEVKDTISIPSSAVYTDDAGSYVFVLSNGRAEKKYVQPGIKGEGLIQITEGLSEGEKVITSPLTEEDIGTRYVEN